VRRSNPEAVFQNHILYTFGAASGLILLANVVKVIPNPWGPGNLTFGLGEGTPDIVGSVDGRFCGWELKVPGRTSKKHQREVANAWRSQGAFVAEVHTDEEFEASIKRCRDGASE
jgi:hypothetical protein